MQPMLGQTPYILIADDTQDNLDLLATAAEIRGWKYETAMNADEIITQVKQHCIHDPENCFDALIVDIHYWQASNDGASRKTGIKAIREIRREHFADIPVIFITGYDTALVKDEALAVGQEIIAKPFDPDYVLNRAQIWMDWAKPTSRPENDRRGYGVNRSGYYRRRSDIPAVTAMRRVEENTHR